MKIHINFIPQEEEEEVVFRIHGMKKHVTQAIDILNPGEKEAGYLLCKKEEKFFKILTFWKNSFPSVPLSVSASPCC